MARRRAISRSVCSWCIPDEEVCFWEAYTGSVQDVVAVDRSGCCGIWPIRGSRQRRLTRLRGGHADVRTTDLPDLRCQTAPGRPAQPLPALSVVGGTRDRRAGLDRRGAPARPPCEARRYRVGSAGAVRRKNARNRGGGASLNEGRSRPSASWGADIAGPGPVAPGGQWSDRQTPRRPSR
jgi:hypothetical protein